MKGTILGFYCPQAVLEDYDEEYVLVVDGIRFRESELPTNDKSTSHIRSGSSETLGGQRLYLALARRTHRSTVHGRLIFKQRKSSCR
jgi:hypothetical protein